MEPTDWLTKRCTRKKCKGRFMEVSIANKEDGTVTCNRCSRTKERFEYHNDTTEPDMAEFELELDRLTQQAFAVLNVLKHGSFQSAELASQLGHQDVLKILIAHYHPDWFAKHHYL